MTHTFSKTTLFIAIALLGGWGCASEPNLTDIQKQVQTLILQQEASHKLEQQTIDRIEAVESQLDEHDFLVGELIKTEEEASLDTRHLLEKLERTSAMLREQIEQTRSTTQRRDQDLSIRVKALEGRIDNVIHQPRSLSEPTEVNTPNATSPSPDPKETQTGIPTAPTSPKESTGGENEASAFRSAYKVFLNGNYDRASVEFQRFVKNYPSTTLTPQAYYYLGESFYIQKHYDPAKQALEQVVSRYPTSKYRSHALYKLGQIMLETDQRSKAQELWNSIIQDYPDSPESTQAKEQLKKSGLS
ncbi:MAG TPA: tol-pal system protein YbgF [Nitrospirales bacterium]|nr:tol-pal system protein YbgF [Nitrospiraceae bacterium]HNP30189.1 tol-pal system protein YbgF [Nitrospirales bacterium]